jgi:hypothetical protein
METHYQVLSHIIKTIQYRFIKAITGSKEDFGLFRLNEHTRSPNEIVYHMFDLAAKTKCMIKSGHFDVPSHQLPDFSGETKRFLSELEELQLVIDSFTIDLELSKKLLQGPILDMVTHIGQISMLNGLHGNKIQKESYYNADIK